MLDLACLEGLACLVVIFGRRGSLVGVRRILPACAGLRRAVQTGSGCAGGCFLFDEMLLSKGLLLRLSEKVQPLVHAASKPEGGPVAPIARAHWLRRRRDGCHHPDWVGGWQEMRTARQEVQENVIRMVDTGVSGWVCRRWLRVADRGEGREMESRSYPDLRQGNRIQILFRHG